MKKFILNRMIGFFFFFKVRFELREEKEGKLFIIFGIVYDFVLLFWKVKFIC